MMAIPEYDIWFHEEGETKEDAIVITGISDPVRAAIKVVKDRYTRRGDLGFLVENNVKVSVAHDDDIRIVEVYGEIDIDLNGYEVC